MTWQQFLIALWLVANAALSLVSATRDRETSSGEAALGVILAWSFYIAIALVLHSGGFW
jgi:hypothetical protein